MRVATNKIGSAVRAADAASAPAPESWVSRCRATLRRLRPASSRQSPPADVVLPFWDRDAAFSFALAALRQNELALAEHELTRGDGDRAVNDARCLNLLGVIHECRGYRHRARCCYVRAAKLDKSFAAPRTNLRRYYELTAIGNTQIVAALGDETSCAL